MEAIKTKAGKLYTFIFLGLIHLFIATPGCAQGNILLAGRPVIAVGVGAAITSGLGASQYFPALASTDEFYRYSSNHVNRVRALFDIFAGEEWALCAPWSLQLGLDFNQIQTFAGTGTFLQGLDLVSADHYTYRYSLLARQLLAEGKLLYQYKDRYYFYFMLGLGAAFNKAYDYSTDKPFFATFTRHYNNHSQTSFSYNAGIGIDTTIACGWRAGIGYRFTDLGKVSLGPSNIRATPVSGTLVQNHLYVNEVVAQLSWII